VQSLIVRRPGALALLAPAAVLLAALLIAPSAEAASLYACQKKKGGTLRIVASKTKCKKTEKKLKWNSSGTSGKNGKNGTNGTNGTNGANGAPGAQGIQGIQGLQGPPGPGAKRINGTATVAFLTETPMGSITVGDAKFDFFCTNAFIVNVVSIKVTSPSAGVFSGFGIKRKNPAGNATATPDYQRIATTANTLSDPIAGVTTTADAGSGTDNNAAYTYIFDNVAGTTVLSVAEDVSNTCSIKGWAVQATS
jgi:hypothetical protein